ncbi:MAG: replication factor C small subunit [Candidatus Nitrosoabyssus spongiisocia]|nr:MAG: replication factor C small subunit [Nitrosopumilaceae archaeon AB1(1)]
MSMTDIMWVEKYRPTKLSDIVGQTEIIKSIEALLKNQSEMPHLLFSGSAGVGKTTTALCLTHHILGKNRKNNVLELNASDERGIGMVRERVKKFSRFVSMGADVPFKIIILDEADEMTSDAQTALRRIIEDTAKYCRFILIANNVSKIIGPIQSRCSAFKFSGISKKELTAHLKTIAKSEKIKVDEEGLNTIYEHAKGDLRHSINILQTVSSSGDVTVDNVKAISGLAKSQDVEGILAKAIKGDVSTARTEMIELIKLQGMSEADFLKYINQAANKMELENLSKVIQIIAKYDYRILVGANAEIQLSALLSELSNIEN